jgi:Mg-chelatase subunit ChlD
MDVALVLAVDGSGSINTEEFFFQQQAIVAALRDRDVLEAFTREGTVAVAVLYWGDAEWPVQQTEFVHIEGAEDVERLVSDIESMPRRVLGNTGLSMGLSAALDMLQTVGCAHRLVINVSADGTDTISPNRKNRTPSLPEVRARAGAANVTINALAISTEHANLKFYFENEVIVGSDAFVVEIKHTSDYAETLRRKLIREISPSSLTQNENSEYLETAFQYRADSAKRVADAVRSDSSEVGHSVSP